MTLSESQSMALRFLQTRKSPLLVCGAAGVGKSFLMSFYVNKLLSAGETVIVSCPTNKAKGVMASYLHKLDNDNLVVNTISSLLSLTRQFDDNGIMRFVKKWKGKRPPSLKEFPDNTRIIIDEASMIPEYETNILLDIPHDIIFTGDKYQLYPVNELNSKVFASSIHSFEITKTMRTNNEILLTIFNCLRHQVARASRYELKDTVSFAKTYNKIEGTNRDTFYICSGPKKFLRKVNAFIENKENMMILCYTRKKAALYNNQVREATFGENIDRYVNGERLVFDSYYDDGTHQRYTSDDIVVNRVHVENKYSSYFGRKFKVYALLTRTEENKDVVYYKIHEDNIKSYRAEVASKRLELQRLGRKNKIASVSLWEEFNKGTATLDAPLVYNYAMTVHKSQGSTYENVFLDVDDCNNNGYTDHETFTRLVYTGSTRSSVSLTMLMCKNYFY